jgi:hypothetical protein
MVVVAVVLAAFFVKSNRQPSWEHKVDYNLSAPSLNRYANQGWELVAVATPQNGDSAIYFKRSKQNQKASRDENRAWLFKLLTGPLNPTAPKRGNVYGRGK